MILYNIIISYLYYILKSYFNKSQMRDLAVLADDFFHTKNL